MYYPRILRSHDSRLEREVAAQQSRQGDWLVGYGSFGFNQRHFFRLGSFESLNILFQELGMLAVCMLAAMVFQEMWAFSSFLEFCVNQYKTSNLRCLSMYYRSFLIYIYI